MLGLVGCEQLGSAEEQAPAGPPPAQVTTLVVEPEDVPVNYEYVGQVAGSLEVEVRSRVTGIVNKRHYREGGKVAAGDVLFTLDRELFVAQVAQARAAVAAAQAEHARARAQFVHAQNELKRVKPLAGKKLVSTADVDAAASAVDVARAGVQVAEATIGQAEASLQTAQINLDYTTIRAPVDGVVGRALVNTGALVQAGGNGLLTTMVQLDPVYINFGVAENDQLARRDELATGELRLPDHGYQVALMGQYGEPSGVTGSLDFQDYKVDTTTGSFGMRATLPNADGTLSPGQFARVQLVGAVRPQAIVIPQRAVLDGPVGKYVYVVTPSEQGGMWRSSARSLWESGSIWVNHDRIFGSCAMA
jgi:membrane fusion protein (multidrug efflux system)